MFLIWKDYPLLMDKLIKWMREGSIITGQLLAVNLPQGKTRILRHNVV